MTSPTWWTWVSASTRSWCWKGKPGMLQSMILQRVRHYWATKLNTILYYSNLFRDPSTEFSSVAQSCPTLCDPMNHSMLGLPVHHKLLKSTQIHVHQVSDTMQTSHPLSSPSPPAFSLSQNQGLFQWVWSLYQMAKVLEPQLQHQSFRWIFRTDFL